VSYKSKPANSVIPRKPVSEKVRKISEEKRITTRMQEVNDWQEWN
jgi:hypothetical protein